MPFWDIVLYLVSFFGLFTAVFFLVTLIENKSSIKNPKPPKKLPKVTIIVPACNEELCLAKTVKSLLRLNYPKKKLQIIVVDDGSTDKTLKIARGFEKDGVLVLTKPNGGKGTALNLGMEHSTGEFVGCLDADSIVEPNALFKMLGYFNKKSVMAVTPSLKCTKGKTIWQKVQVIEFLLGVYLRKVFAYLGSIRRIRLHHMHRRHRDIAEDTIIGLRDRERGRRERLCGPDAYVHHDQETEGKMVQGIPREHAEVQTHPILQEVRQSRAFRAAQCISFSSDCHGHGVNLYNVNFDIWRLIELSWDPFYLDQSPLMLIGLVALVIGVLMVYLAKRMSKERQNLALSYIFFMLLYLPLYAYWWASAIHARVADKDVGWRGRKRKESETRYY
jgi:glycosyltransferase involved in cell wall biosynthesis